MEKTRICKECFSEDIEKGPKMKVAMKDVSKPKKSMLSGKKGTHKLVFKTPDVPDQSKKTGDTVEIEEEEHLTIENLKQKLMMRLETDVVEIEDTSEFGRGGVYSILIVSPHFEGLGSIGREKLIDSALKEERKRIIISRQKTFTPSQWEKMGKKDPTYDTVASFGNNTVEQMSKMVFKDEKTKYTPDALKMTTEMMRLYVVEAASRASSQAKCEGSTVVELEHLEKILPQLLLDFA